MRENQQKGLDSLPTDLTSQKPKEKLLSLDDVLNIHSMKPLYNPSS